MRHLLCVAAHQAATGGRWGPALQGKAPQMKGYKAVTQQSALQPRDSVFTIYIPCKILLILKIISHPKTLRRKKDTRIRYSFSYLPLFSTKGRKQSHIISLTQVQRTRPREAKWPAWAHTAKPVQSHYMPDTWDFQTVLLKFPFCP